MMNKKSFLSPSSIFGGASAADIPAASSHPQPDKVGYLLKLTGKGFLYPGTWKRRFCVLKGSKFYYYEKEDSRGNEKTSGVINLEYYDLCEEATGKDGKKAPNVFIISTSDKTFFDSGKYLFSADTLTDMNDWIRKIQRLICKVKGKRKAAPPKPHYPGLCAPQSASTPTSPNISNILKAKHEEKFGALEVPSSARLYNATKHRAKGPKGRRLPQRKSMMPRTKLSYTDETVSPYIIDHRMRANSLSALEMDSSGGDGGGGNHHHHHHNHPENWLSRSVDLDENDASGGSSNQDLTYQYSSSDESLVHEALKKSLAGAPALTSAMNGAAVHSQNAYNLRAGGSKSSKAKQRDEDYVAAQLPWVQPAPKSPSPTRTMSLTPMPDRSIVKPSTREQLVIQPPPQIIQSKESIELPLDSGEPHHCEGDCGAPPDVEAGDAKKTTNLIHYLNQKMMELLHALAIVKSDVTTAQRDVGQLQGNLQCVQTGTGDANERIEKMCTHMMQLEKQMIRNLKDTESMHDKARELIGDAEKAKEEFTQMKQDCEMMLSRLKTASEEEDKPNMVMTIVGTDDDHNENQSDS